MLETLRWTALAVQTGSFLVLGGVIFAQGDWRLALAQLGLAGVTVAVYAP